MRRYFLPRPLESGGQSLAEFLFALSTLVFTLVGFLRVLNTGFFTWKCKRAGYWHKRLAVEGSLSKTRPIPVSQCSSLMDIPDLDSLTRESPL